MEAVKILSHFLLPATAVHSVRSNMQTIFRSPPHFPLQKTPLNIYTLKN